MKALLKKRVAAHVVEGVIMFFIALFGLAALYVFFVGVSAWNRGSMLNPDVVILEVLIILAVLILAQMVVLLKVYETVFLSNVDIAKVLFEAEEFFEKKRKR